MGRGKKLFLALIMTLAAISLVSMFVIFQSVTDALQPEEESFSHVIEYDATLQVNSSVENASLMLPYPESEEFAKALNNDSEIEKPEGWNLSISDSDYGSMLEIETGSLEPYRNGSGRSELGYQDTYDIEVRIEYNRSLETRNGLFREPHIPRINSTASDHCTGSGECFSSTSSAYLEYESSNDTFLYMDIDLEGRNDWWALGWTGNSYSQEFRTGIRERVTGPQENWIFLNGTEEQASGTYRD